MIPPAVRLPLDNDSAVKEGLGTQDTSGPLQGMLASTTLLLRWASGTRNVAGIMYRVYALAKIYYYATQHKPF